MKNIATTVSTGDQIFQTEAALHGKVGMYKNGVIALHWDIDEFSCITERITARKLNQLIKTGTITKI